MRKLVLLFLLIQSMRVPLLIYIQTYVSSNYDKFCDDERVIMIYY